MKYHNNDNLVVFEKLSFQNVFCTHKSAKWPLLNSSDWKSVLKILRFHDVLVSREGLTEERKLRFQISLPWCERRLGF